MEFRTIEDNVLPLDHELITESAKLGSIISRYHSQALLYLEENLRIQHSCFHRQVSQRSHVGSQTSYPGRRSSSFLFILLPRFRTNAEDGEILGQCLQRRSSSRPKPTDIWLKQRLDFTCSRFWNANITIYTKTPSSSFTLFFNFTFNCKCQSEFLKLLFWAILMQPVVSSLFIFISIRWSVILMN